MKTIIIEGTNGSGKSRLAEQLSEKYGMIVVHAGGHCKSHAEAVSKCFIQSDFVIRGNYILDRTQVISYLVYQSYSVEGARQLQQFLDQIEKEAIVIYCVGKGVPVDNKDKAHYDKTLRLKVVKERKDLSAKYGVIMNSIPHIEYDFKANNGLEDLFKRLEL